MSAASIKALEVLATILENLEGGNPIRAGALLSEDDRTILEHVREAVQALDEKLNPREEVKVIPNSKRPRINYNIYSGWSGWIGKNKVERFELNEEKAKQWLRIQNGLIGL
jgi:hypothetical protein